MVRHDTVTGVHLAAYQAHTGKAIGVHRDHRMRHDPVCIAFLYWSQSTAALRGGGEFHLRGILNRQNMAAGDSRAGSQAPSLDDLRRHHLLVGEEPARSQFATAVTTQPAQAYRPARDHPFENRGPFIEARVPPIIPTAHPYQLPVFG